MSPVSDDLMKKNRPSSEPKFRRGTVGPWRTAFCRKTLATEDHLSSGTSARSRLRFGSGLVSRPAIHNQHQSRCTRESFAGKTSVRTLPPEMEP